MRIFILDRVLEKEMKEEKEHLPGCYDHNEEGYCLIDSTLAKMEAEQEKADVEYHEWKEEKWTSKLLKP